METRIKLVAIFLLTVAFVLLVIILAVLSVLKETSEVIVDITAFVTYAGAVERIISVKSKDKKEP